MVFTDADILEMRNKIKLLEEQEQLQAQQQAQIDSDARKTTAINYVNTLDLTLKSSTTPEKKTECYDLMEFLKSEMNGKDGETRQELQKKIDELLVQANLFKDLQRSEKIV